MSRSTISVVVLSLVIALLPAAVHAQKFLGKDVNGWIAELGKESDEKARRNAAFALGKMERFAVDALPALQRSLSQDGSAKVREASSFALGEIVRNSLQAAAGDAKYEAHVAKALDKQLVPQLSKLLKDDPDWHVRRSAAFALGCLDKDAGSARAALEAALRDTSAPVRQNAAWAIGRIGPEGIVKLREALADPDAYVKRDAVQSLDLLTLLEPAALRPALGDLLRLCGDADSEVRRATVKALIRIVGAKDGKAAIEPLRSVVVNEKEDQEIRTNAALALSNIGGAEAAPAINVLVTALQRGDIELRRQAAAALGKFGKEAVRTIPELLKAMSDPDMELRKHAAMALGDMGPAAESAVPALVNLLTAAADVPEPRKAAGTALKQIGSSLAAVQAVPRIVNLVGNAKDDAAVRERAVWALQVHGLDLRKMNGVIPSFVQVLKEPKGKANRMLQYTCACLLGVLQRDTADAAVVDTLADFLKDTDVAIYEGTLATAQGSGIETGIGKTTVKELSVGDARVNAVDALQYIGAARVVQRADIVRQLRVLADDPKSFRDLRTKCAAFLKELGK